MANFSPGLEGWHTNGAATVMTVTFEFCDSSNTVVGTHRHKRIVGRLARADATRRGSALPLTAAVWFLAVVLGLSGLICALHFWRKKTAWHLLFACCALFEAGVVGYFTTRLWLFRGV